MKLPRRTPALIIGTAAIAAAVLAYESSRAQVYSLGIYSAGVTYYNQLALGSGPNSCGVQQYAEVGWVPAHPNPHPHAFTELRFGAHKLRVRTPFSLIGGQRLAVAATAAVACFLGIASLLCLRPRGTRQP